MTSVAAHLLLLAASVASDQFAEFDGARVHYTVEGGGPVSILQIHGWACDATFWRLQTPEFVKEQYRVIAVDLPGHGQSEAPRNVDYSIERFAGAVTAVIKHAAVDKAVVIGHSMGVPVAVKVLQDNPAVVQSVVAVDGPIWKFQRTTVPQWLRNMQRDYRTIAAGFIDSMFVQSTPLFLRAEIKRKMLLTPSWVGLSALMVMGASKVWLEPPATVPVLAVMAGRRPKDDRKRLHQEVFRNLRYELFEDAGHFVMMEHPERFNKLVLSFLHSVPQLHTTVNSTH